MAEARAFIGLISYAACYHTRLVKIYGLKAKRCDKVKET